MEIELKPGSSYLVRDLGEVEYLTNNTSQIDLSVINPELTVKEVRLLLRAIAERSFGSHRLLLIPKAEQLSSIIQTTLLKTIEEPPAHLIIVVQTNSPNLLLGTVRSRLHTLKSKVSINYEPTICKAADLEGATREKALEILNSIEQSTILGENLSAEKLSIIASANQRLRLNCNVKLTIDWFLLRWQVVSGTE